LSPHLRIVIRVVLDALLRVVAFLLSVFLSHYFFPVLGVVFPVALAALAVAIRCPKLNADFAVGFFVAFFAI
jgi:hypothetical protein